jgi:IS4 transposase
VQLRELLFILAAWYSGSSCKGGWSKTRANVKAGNRKLPNRVKLITISRRRMMMKKKNTKKEVHEEERRKV